MYKLERKEPASNWYEVMLSPFKTKEEVYVYYQKYSKYYPHTNTTYRVTNIESGNKLILKS